MMSGKYAPVAKNPVGRPTKRTKETEQAIFTRLMLGESLVKITDDPAMPAYTTVLRWLEDDEQFRGKYTRARVIQAQYLEHKAIEIAMNATPATAYLAKVQFDALKWQMARLNPRVYGDGPTTEVNTTVNNVVVSAELMRRVQARKAELKKAPGVGAHAAIAEAKAEPDPLATHIFVSRRQVRHIPDTKRAVNEARQLFA